VAMKTTGHEKLRVTVMLCITGNHNKLQPYVILNRKKKIRGLVRQRIIPTERPPLVGEVSANFSG
jgi:hypothetical protein